jgi:hypothetical protein
METPGDVSNPATKMTKRNAKTATSYKNERRVLHVFARDTSESQECELLLCSDPGMTACLEALALSQKTYLSATRQNVDLYVRL